MCKYIYAYVGMYMQVYVYIYMRMWACICKCMYIYMCVYVYICLYMYTCSYVYICIVIFVYVCMYIEDISIHSNWPGFVCICLKYCIVSTRNFVSLSLIQYSTSSFSSIIPYGKAVLNIHPLIVRLFRRHIYDKLICSTAKVCKTSTPTSINRSEKQKTHKPLFM